MAHLQAGLFMWSKAKNRGICILQIGLGSRRWGRMVQKIENGRRLAL
jgi:hypothetical protein